MRDDQREFYRKQTNKTTRLLYLIVTLKRKDVQERREASWKAAKGLRRMEFNSFLLLHDLERMDVR